MINFTFELHFSQISLLLEVRQLKNVPNIFREDKKEAFQYTKMKKDSVIFWSQS